MSSRFNPRTTPRKPPLWCKTAIHAKVSGMLSPMPRDLIGYAEWIEPPMDPPAEIAESVCLYGDGTGNHYSGKATAAYYELKLTLDRINDTDNWEIYLRLYADGAFWDHESWHDFWVFPLGIFDTGLQTRTFPPLPGSVAFHATG